jgi:hypothetical protein
MDACMFPTADLYCRFKERKGLCKERKGLWKFNKTLLHDPEYVKHTNKLLRKKLKQSMKIRVLPGII